MATHPADETAKTGPVMIPDPPAAVWVELDPAHRHYAELCSAGGDRQAVHADDLRRLAADCIRGAQAMELWRLDAAELFDRLRSTELDHVHDVEA